MKQTAIAALAECAWSSCSSDGISTAEVERAAEQRVRQELSLPPGSQLETRVVVGRPRDGDPTLCGTVTGTGPNGTAIPRQRFVSSTDPAKWLLFSDTETPGRVSMPSMSADCTALCAGADE